MQTTTATDTTTTFRLPSVLIVDDEQCICELLAEILTILGCQVQTAGDGRAALEIYRRNFQEIDLVLTDLVMPGMHGLEVLESMRRINQRLKAVIVSGYAGISGGIEGTRNVCGMLPKPFNLNQVKSVVTQALHESGRDY